MSDSTDLRFMFVDYALGVISAPELQALEAALREDSDLRRDFIEYMNIDSALGDMAALSGAELAEFETTKLADGSRAIDAGASGAIAKANDRPFDGQPRKGTELQAGMYRLGRGLLQLQFDGGVMVYVEAPARFDAVSNSRVLLHSGRLSAKVPPEGIGFTVETPEAEVVDLGTEFSVDVEGGASEVHVFDGLVRVNPGASNQRDV